MINSSVTTAPNLPVKLEVVRRETLDVEHFLGTRDRSAARLLPMRELAGDIRRLSEVSETKAVFSVARQWLVLAMCLGSFIVVSPHLTWMAWVPTYLLLGLIVASRQHAFLGLVHEGVHYRLSTNRPWNDFLSDMFCAFPVGVCTDVYRRRHLLHHQHTNTDQDPDWVGMHMDDDWAWPKDHVTTAKLFALDLLGLAAHKILILLFLWSPLQAAVMKHVSLSWAERIRLATFLGTAVALLTVFHGWGWFFLLWVLPMVTIFGALVRLRSVAEHLICPSENELNETRHVDPTWLERLTLAPFNVNYHLAHHLFPSVPWYNLPKLHARLQELEVFQANAKITKSYLGLKQGVLAEMLRPNAKQAS